MATKQMYGFGNTVFCIVSPEPLLEIPQLASFAVRSEVAPDYTFWLQPKENAPTSARNTGVFLLDRNGNDIYVYTEKLDQIPNMAISTFLSWAGAYELLTERGAFVLHASYVCKDGRALLFSAPSGTGKSTQAHYWQAERGAEIINEDRVVIFPRDGTYYATGCWAMGSALVTRNAEAPITALVLLSQGDTNTVRRPRPLTVLQSLIEQCSYDPNDAAQRTRILDILCNVLSSVRVLSYECINHPSAVDELEKYL